MISALVNRFKKHTLISVIALAIGLTGCGGGDSGPAPVNTPVAQSISGGGVKGPLANAVVTVFAFDPSQPGFEGAVVATATTDSKAAITGLSLPLPLNPPYIMEFTSTPGTTTDITTGAFPVITTMRTVITRALLDGGEQLYATPTTTVAADVAVLTAADTNGIAGIQADEFETALTSAASLVVSTLGFGMDGGVDIYDAPPLVDNTTVSTAELANVAAYRTAVEALTAMAYEISRQVAGATADTVLADIAADLADNGLIDGSVGTTLTTNTLQVLQQDPARLPIPNSPTSQTVADVQTILAAETAVTGATTDTTALTDGTVVTVAAPAATDPDIDDDGVLNADDAFPLDGSESVDTDGDGIGDVADPDDDNNGILDEDEGASPAPTASDTDGDGVDDGVDNCPVNFNPAQTDTDGDTEGDACDADDDDDGVVDVNDAFPLDDTESIDTDGDGIGDVADPDADNDGVDDVDEEADISPIDGTTSCSVLTDCDGDGVLDGADFDPLNALVTFNFAPVANDDTATANEDAATFSIDVTANDSDNDGNPADTITLMTVGSNDASLGAVVPNGNSIDYTPVADASGTDTFTYTVTDGTVTSTATVTVTIVAVNDDPVATNDAETTDEDIPVTTANVLINDSDVDGDTLSVEAGNPVASNGVVVNNNDGTFTYTPNANFNGPDSFTYTVIDGNGGSATGTVDITVIAVNDNPTANPDTAMTDEDTPVTTVDVTLNDSDVDGIAVLSVLPGDPVAANGTVVNNNDGTFTYTPDADYFGPDSFTYNLSDGTTGTAVGTVNITIEPVNDDPVAVLDEIETDEDSSISTGNVTKNDTDVDGDPLTATLLTNAIHGNVEPKGTGGSFTYTPDPDYSGPDSFTYTLSDGNGGTATGTVQITVLPLNDAPVANTDSATTDEDTSVTTVDVRLNDTDADNDALTATLLANASNGNVTDNADGTFTYSPDADYYGPDSFTYTLSDSGSDSTATGTVNITVKPVNDAPVGNPDAASAGVSTPTVVDVLSNDTDVDGDTLSITAVSAGSRGGTITHDGSTVSFTDVTGTTGTETFTYDMWDGTDTITGITVTMTVTANVPPVANPDSAITDEDTSVTTVDVLANDTDGGDGPGELSIVDADTISANNGTVVNHGDGTFTYTPDTDFTGDDSFTYTVSDTAGTSVGTVTITVIPVNDLPFAELDNDETAEDTPFTTINVLANDTDNDGPNTLFVQSADTVTAAGGSVADNGDGTFAYSPPLDFNGSDQFSYTVSDGLDASVGTVFINVTPVNDPPVASNDNATTTVDTAVTTGNVLLNDTDVDGPFTLFIQSADTVTTQGGSVVNKGDGTFIYTPSTGFTGVDSFNYMVSDTLLAVSGTVTVTVNAPGEPIAMTTLMSPSEGGIAAIDELGRPDEYEYWTDNWDSVTGLFTGIDYVYNHATSVFDQAVGNGELILSAGQWVEEGNIYASDDGSGGLIASIREAGNDANEIASVLITARYVGIQGQLISDYLDSIWQGAMIDPNAVFNTGAKLLTEVRFENLTESYNLWVFDWCQEFDPARYELLNMNCNAVNVDFSVNVTGYAQVLDEVIAATAWVDPDDFTTPPDTVSIGWNGSKELKVQLVAGGAANYYVIDWSASDPAAYVAPVVAGTDWIRNTDPGVDMIQVQIPASFVDQFPDSLEESLNYILAVQNGFVRGGEKEVVGSVEFDRGSFNGNAMSDILANFSAPRVLNCNTIGGPYSYTDFETVVADCVPFAMTAASLENKIFASLNNPSEVVAYNAGGTGFFSNDGGLTTFPITWSIDANGYLDIASASPLITPFRDKLVAYGIDPYTGGTVIKVYSEESDTGSDLVFDGTADGEIWDDIAIEITAPAPALSCGYTSPWDSINNQPVFNSFTDFELVVADCGGVLPTIDTDVIGVWVETWTDPSGDWEEVVTFNAGGSGSFAETLNGVAQGTPAPFSWSLYNNMVVITDSVEIIDVWARTASGIKAYTEETGWGGDLVLGDTADGEIWDAFYVKQ